MEHVAPSLPPGWTQHFGPDGTAYYHHKASGQSTYTRPVLPGNHSTVAAKPAAVSKPKEKPARKTVIPGTDGQWARVVTTAGNVFFTHLTRKESVWTVPAEIAQAVADCEEKGWDQVDRDNEVERIRAELREMGVEPGTGGEAAEAEEAAAKGKKRKVQEDQAGDEGKSKKARVEDDDDDRPANKPKKALSVSEATQATFGTDKVNLSVDEAKALFMSLLRDKNLNPLTPWDSALPELITDPRYALLPSLSARREVFDEYCRVRARELREEKAKAGIESKAKKTPEEAFDELLNRTCTSTRTSWTDWRRTVKKERAFLEYGRSEREREARFKAHLTALGERKRRDAARAEKDFFALLKEKVGNAKGANEGEDEHLPTSGLTSDPRYDGVGSSSLREELYGSYIRTLKNAAKAEAVEADMDPDSRRKARQERAERERAAAVRAQKEKVDADAAKARGAMGAAEAEDSFRTLLTDAIRDVMPWSAAEQTLANDPRFVITSAMLPTSTMRDLFEGHVSRLRTRHVATLHGLFAAHAPKLSDPYPGASVERSPPVERLGWRPVDVEDEFSRWSRARKDQARKDFDEMLKENSFVEFWGRARKLGGDDAARIDEEEVEGEEGGGTADLKALARGVDADDVIKVVKNDKRYLDFEHVPEDRDRWVQEYLQRMAAPKLSVHVPEHA
ncbi:hypothetical protein BKA62DRAFT_714902 [Auriculariales sp. MPI-PUGE-AT-0066]|nr:hypothetical protein BKA62DRAFT_714902 [Auriculariales sp. MPI-PUGE-AT-0066]